MYSEVVRDHALHPRNRGAMERPHLIGEGKFPRCGDKVKLFVCLRDGLITRASFTASACAPAVAACSLATTLIVGLSLEQARQVLVTELPKLLGDLPASKRHAILLVFECLSQILEHAKSNPNNEGETNV